MSPTNIELLKDNSELLEELEKWKKFVSHARELIRCSGVANKVEPRMEVAYNRAVAMITNTAKVYGVKIPDYECEKTIEDKNE